MLCFPLRSVHNAAIVSVDFLKKLCHNKWNLFSFMRFTCICSQFLVKTAAVGRCAVYIIYWQYALIFVFFNYKISKCCLRSADKSEICSVQNVPGRHADSEQILTPQSLPAVSHNA